MNEQSSNDNSNDNHVALGGVKMDEPDAYGQAAMLLSESLLHSLVARAVITVGEAIEIVDVAAEVKEDIAAELGDSPATMRKSLAILQSIRHSLAVDLPAGFDRA